MRAITALILLALFWMGFTLHVVWEAVSGIWALICHVYRFGLTLNVLSKEKEEASTGNVTVSRRHGTLSLSTTRSKFTSVKANKINYKTKSKLTNTK